MRKQLCQIALYRNVTTGETSRRFLDIIPRKVTLHNKFRHAEGGTLFREVEVVSFDDQLTERERELMALRPGTGPKMTPAEFYDGWLERLEQATIDSWNPGKFHLVLHSSGWDSRVTSLVLKRLEERLGCEWLGDVVFACYGCECSLHEEVLKYQGWDRHQYTGIVDVVPLFGKMLDFDDAWTWLNGIKPSLSLSIMFAREMMKEHGANPRDTQLWYSYHGNTHDFCRSKNGLYDRVLSQYVSPLSVTAYDTGDLNDMFGHYDVLEYVMRANVSLGPPQRMQRLLVRHVDPELEEIPKKNTRDDFPPIPRSMVERAICDYDESWFGRKVRPGRMRGATGDVVGYHGWWSLWLRAALCEYLLKAGYEIEVEEE